ncbi:SDR family oxidoreductase [Persicimonas caeni]|uniref:SDR family oxidoreductase n=1 Tax=Persicimonas caeni TaxID=2292766 RepID=A0A4Y6PPM3_PERCE|nr:SDR family oxidoreductase [Persicimonas caeni]QDG50264.1 SDR family oxidoreductase [Persicimonas caeni]QED31485.1 SDR family oxidoreductase [Persicimonas caeni]
MSVLILGATSPIARAVAEEYAADGKSVVLAARNADEAEAIASDIAIRFEVDTFARSFDALDIDEHDAFVASVEDEAGPIEVVLVAFGDMGDQEASEEDFERARRVIDVNYTGAASLSEAVARRMVERGAGSIIGISSVAGDRGRKSNYFYGSAKGAFTLYLQGLRNRLADDGVHVMTVKLGFVDTRMTVDLETPIPIANPAKVGKAIARAQGRGVDTFYYPHFWRGIMGIIKAIPESIFKKLSL